MASSNSHINSVMSQLFPLQEIEGENFSTHSNSDEDEDGRKDDNKTQYESSQNLNLNINNLSSLNMNCTADSSGDLFEFNLNANCYDGGSNSANFHYNDYAESSTTNSAQSSRRSSEYTPPSSRRGSGTSIGSSPSSATTMKKNFHECPSPVGARSNYGEMESSSNSHNIDYNRPYTMFKFENQQSTNPQYQQYSLPAPTTSNFYPECYQAHVNQSKHIEIPPFIDTSHATANRQPLANFTHFSQEQHQPVQAASQQSAEVVPPSNSRRGSGNEGAAMSAANTPVDSSIEEMVCSHCQDILSEASTNSLKAVELANTLRARIGTEVLSSVRVMYGGLLSVLEKHPTIFNVQRISKNDQVSLLSSAVRSTSSNAKNFSDSNVGINSGNDGIKRNHKASGGRQFQHYHLQQQQPQLQDTFYSRFVYVDNVQMHVSNEEIHRNFGSFGEVDTLGITSNHQFKAVNVSYRSLQDAIKALTTLTKQGFSVRCVDPNNNYVQPQRYSNHNSKRNESNNNFHSRLSTQQQQQRGSTVAPYSDPVLERLCDETYVPTQSWIINESVDLRYCRTISTLIQHFGGCMTISKLRGLLRQRLNAGRNIKSVPLKALLNAYPRYFALNANLVSLSRP